MRIILFSILLIMNEKVSSQLQIGVFADCQYCDCKTAGTRFYGNSITKLKACLSTFNENKKLLFVAGLGDLIDRDFESYSKVNEVLKTSIHNVFHVSGNHDFSVSESYLDKVPEQLGQISNYYSISKKVWTFIFLNGNEISLQSTNKSTVKCADGWIEKLKIEKKPNAQTWNGALGKEQLKWLDERLIESEKKGHKVAIFCHYPVFPFDSHCLWDSEEILKLLEKYNCVKTWINGHNHAGNYAQFGNIHFLNLKGMVETETENAFCEITFNKNSIQVKGFGREINRILPIKAR